MSSSTHYLSTKSISEYQLSAFMWSILWILYANDCAFDFHNLKLTIEVDQGVYAYTIVESNFWSVDFRIGKLAKWFLSTFGIHAKLLNIFSQRIWWRLELNIWVNFIRSLFFKQVEKFLRLICFECSARNLMPLKRDFSSLIYLKFLKSVETEKMWKPIYFLIWVKE